jgi:hypothetical protein
MRGSGTLLVLLGAALAACSKGEAGAGAPVEAPRAAAAAPGKGVSFEVVTVHRPESVEEYHRLYRASYDMCALIRQAKSLPPPPPLRQPPADFISQRNTRISDGAASYYVKHEYFIYKVESEGETPSCESGERKASSIGVMRDGMVFHTDVDEDGKAYPAEPEQAQPPEPGRDDAYTEPKVVKGFAVKCMKLAPGSDKLLTEQCAADLKPGTLYEGDRPIVVAGRVTVVQQVQGPTLIEPVVIKVGHRVDRSVFDAAGKR